MSTAITPNVTLAGGATTQTGAIQTVTGIANDMPIAQYKATRPVLGDGYGTTFQANTRGDIAFTEQFQPLYEDNSNGVAAISLRQLANGAYSPSLLVADYGATITKNAKAAPGILTAAVIKNRNAVVRYFGIYNKTVAALANDVPILQIEVATGTQLLIGADILSNMGLRCSVGISYGWSTWDGYYVAATNTDHDTQLFGV